METLQQHLDWFAAWTKSTSFSRLKERPVAYFCAEFALENRVPTFSGGLGVLAGDVIREAADRGIPMVGVGLYYRHGYICPTTLVDGREVEACTDLAPERVGLAPVLDAAGATLLVHVPIQDRKVGVRAWKWNRGGGDVYLLDSDIESNTPSDRRITERLYVADKETRLKQEILLGIGGLRLLEALDIHPSVYHLNEGHSAMLGLELIRHQMQERHLGFDEAKQFARRRMVMTNHTLVPAGNEVFSDDLVALQLTAYAGELSVSVNEVVKLGLVQESSTFSLTTLALRLSGIVNAVSRLHAAKAKEIWRDHPMASITNGVHLPTWDRIGDEAAQGPAFWDAHMKRKDELLAIVREKVGRAWDRETLLIGWGRRFASYKRPLALLEDLERFAALARDADRPIRAVFAGRPHPSDEEGQRILRELRERVDGPLRDVAAYLPDYDLDLAKRMVAGCDVWLNTPVVGFEACGTSGMKAALNGALPMSTPDGWVHEAELFRVGWRLDSDRVAQDVLDRLERDVAPMYYARDAEGVPTEWLELMKNARELIRSRFSATRMLRQYLDTLYL